MGDPACFLAETCLECGRFLEEPADVCPHCGADLIGDTTEVGLPVM